MKRLHLFSLEMMHVDFDRFPLILSFLDAFRHPLQYFIEHTVNNIVIFTFQNEFSQFQSETSVFRGNIL